VWRISPSSDSPAEDRTHKGGRPFACGECDTAFSQSSTSARKCTRTHNGAKPFPCGVCDKMFSRSSALRVRERIHEGTYPLVRGDDGRTLRDGNYVNRHTRFGSGANRIFCGKATQSVW
jgi:hypothetical protein